MGCGASKNEPQNNQTTEKKEVSAVTETPVEKIDRINCDNNQINERSLPPSKIEKLSSEFVTIVNTEDQSEGFEFSNMLKKRFSKNKIPPNVQNLSSNENSNNLNPNNGMPSKSFDKSNSSIQIDKNVDFTVIKMDNVNNKKDENTNKNILKKEKEKNKVNDDLEILNVDDIEQTEGNVLLAQKPLGYKGDYYIMNQELMNKNNIKNINKLDEITEGDESIANEDENEIDEPKVIKNSFFTEDENTDEKKKKSGNFFRSNSSNKNNKNDIVVIKNSTLIDSQHNSENALECDINEISDHGKPIRNNNNMSNDDENANTHPFSVC